MIAAMIDVESLEVSKYFVAAAASTLTRETPLALVKNPDEEDGIFFIGEENGEFEDADVEPGGKFNLCAWGRWFIGWWTILPSFDTQTGLFTYAVLQGDGLSVKNVSIEFPGWEMRTETFFQIRWLWTLVWVSVISNSSSFGGLVDICVGVKQSAFRYAYPRHFGDIRKKHVVVPPDPHLPCAPHKAELTATSNPTCIFYGAVLHYYNISKGSNTCVTNNSCPWPLPLVVCWLLLMGVLCFSHTVAFRFGHAKNLAYNKADIAITLLLIKAYVSSPF